MILRVNLLQETVGKTMLNIGVYHSKCISTNKISIPDTSSMFELQSAVKCQVAAPLYFLPGCILKVNFSTSLSTCLCHAS